MKNALRSNFEPGSPLWAMRRAQWKALGLSDEDMLKPKIAVVNGSSELAICFSHLDGIAAIVKEAVRAAGGPLSLVEKGGTIVIDVTERRLGMDVTPEVLEARRRQKGKPVLPAARGRLSIYRRMVRPMSTGAVLIDYERDFE